MSSALTGYRFTMKLYGGGSHVDRELAQAYNKPTVVEEIVADDPKLAPENQSFALRLSGLIGRQDFALSYAYGFVISLYQPRQAL